jgi:cyclic pyranopterin phosphate synthase
MPLDLSLPVLNPLALQAAPKSAGAASSCLRDSFGRAITDLRVSVTDRCNFRCVYCRTGNDGVQYSELATEEYLRMIRLFVSLGIEKVRLTGGEPLLRAGLVEFVEELSHLRVAFGPDGNPANAADAAPIDLALTTNGHLLAGLAQPLKDAGLSRVTVSMDAVDAETFAAITRVPRSFDRVLAGIRAANAAGLGPVKVNCVLLRGFNDTQIEQFAEFSRREQVIVRFIEWMPLEEPSSAPDARTWRPETVVTLDEIVARLNAWVPPDLGVAGLIPLPANAASETARRYTFADGCGEIGIIAPVSHPFCGHCSRIRLTSDGKIRTCLFSQTDHDLAGRLLRGANDAELTAYIQQVVLGKEARHHIGEAGFERPSRSMVHIGG